MLSVLNFPYQLSTMKNNKILPTLLWLISFITILTLEFSNSTPINERKWWNRELSLTGDFHVKWNSNNKEWLTMEMSTNTNGYVAVGFSPNGGMKDADIVLGWVDRNGEPHLKVWKLIRSVRGVWTAAGRYSFM